MNKKQAMNTRVNELMMGITQSLLEPEMAMALTMSDVFDQFPDRSHFKHQESGEIRVGLSFRGVRRLLKKHPNLTVAEVKQVFGLG